MLNDMNKGTLFSEYYKQWVDVYKKGAIREATMQQSLRAILILQSRLCQLVRRGITKETGL